MSKKVKSLNIVGIILFGLGVVYSLLSHEAHDVIPFFANSSHAVHLFVGIGVLVFGTLLLIGAGVIDRRERSRIA